MLMDMNFQTGEIHVEQKFAFDLRDLRPWQRQGETLDAKLAKEGYKRTTKWVYQGTDYYSCQVESI